MSMMRRGLRAFFDSGLTGLGPTPLPLAGLAPAVGVRAGCGGGGAGGAAASSASEPAAPGGATMSAAAALGELIFHDVSLSASGRQACSSCHVAENGHAAANSLPTQMGAADLDLQGARAVPGLRYLAGNRAFRLGACRAWGVEAKFGPSEDSFCRVCRLIAVASTRPKSACFETFRHPAKFVVALLMLS